MLNLKCPKMAKMEKSWIGSFCNAKGILLIDYLEIGKLGKTILTL